MTTKMKGLIAVPIVALVLLLIPLIAMQFTSEVLWTLSDFFIAFMLLLCAGLALWLVIALVKNTRNKIALLAAILFLFFLVWAELAVGIFGTPFAGS